MDNKQLAHVWAQGEKSAGRTPNRNMSFRDNLIFSYNTAIAQRVQNKKGETAYLVNSNKYSATTSGKHMPAVYGALRGLQEPVFTVPDVYSAGSDNVEHYKKQYERLLFDASRARSNADCITSQAARVANEMTEYCVFFGFLVPVLPAINPETLARCKVLVKEETAKKKQEAADILNAGLPGECIRSQCS